MIVRCNLCGMDFNDDGDKHWSQRLSRHEQHHDGSLKRATYNIIRGKVEWLVLQLQESMGTLVCTVQEKRI